MTFLLSIQPEPDCGLAGLLPGVDAQLSKEIAQVRPNGTVFDVEQMPNLPVALAAQEQHQNGAFRRSQRPFHRAVRL